MLEKKVNIYRIDISKSFDFPNRNCYKASIFFEEEEKGSRSTFEKKMIRKYLKDILIDGMEYFMNLPD